MEDDADNEDDLSLEHIRMDDDMDDEDSDSSWEYSINGDDFKIESEYFSLDHGACIQMLGDVIKLTESQARNVTNALTRSTTVQELSLDLWYCPPVAVPLFLDYIKSSPLLNWVELMYEPDQADSQDSDSQETQEFYNAKIGDFLLAVRANPSIQHLQTYVYGSNPRVMYHVLSNNKSLKALNLVGKITEDVARSIKEGMKNNSMIKAVDLMVSDDHTDVIIDGLVGSSVESVSLELDYMHARLSDAVSNMLLGTPTLTTLIIGGSSPSPNCHASMIFFHICHAASKLKGLSLRHLRLSADTGTHPPIEHVNTSLKSLRLERILFVKPRDVRLLWNMEGLQELDIVDPPTYELSTDMHEEGFSAWTELIRRNKDLAKVHLGLYEGDDDAFAHGVLHGARDHESLTIMKISTSVSPRRHVCSWLSEMLQETKSLKQLYFDDIPFDEEFSTPIVEGLRWNHTVKILSFERCEMKAGTLVGILQTLPLNTTMEELSFKCTAHVPWPLLTTFVGGTIGQTLSQVFQFNKSLVKVVVPSIDLSDGRMAEALIGLRGNKVLKMLTLQKCLLDSEAISSLGRALESADIALEEIGLADVSHSSIIDADAQRSFLRSLARMPTIKKVQFWFSTTRGDETCALLLRAVMENKIIRVIEFHRKFWEDRHFKAMVEYYLKLNRFGRSLLDSPNVPMSLWPLILSQMTRQPENVDALFYFVKEYFARKNKAEDDESTELRNVSEKTHSSMDTNHADLWPRL